MEGATTQGVDALGLPAARNLTFSPIAWLLEPFLQRNLDLEPERALQTVREKRELGRLR